jgi:hypothetical protein
MKINIMSGENYAVDYMPIYYIRLKDNANGREISDNFSVGLIGTEGRKQFLEKYGGAYNFYDPRR